MLKHLIYKAILHSGKLSVNAAGIDTLGFAVKHSILFIVKGAKRLALC